MSEEHADAPRDDPGEPGLKTFVIEGEPAIPLDFDNLPEEFTPEVFNRLAFHDLLRLEGEADQLDLTEVQRSSLRARQAEVAASVAPDSERWPTPS